MTSVRMSTWSGMPGGRRGASRASPSTPTLHVSADVVLARSGPLTDDAALTVAIDSGDLIE